MYLRCTHTQVYHNLRKIKKDLYLQTDHYPLMSQKNSITPIGVQNPQLEYSTVGYTNHRHYSVIHDANHLPQYHHFP
jgi:hypothetical protein